MHQRTKLTIDRVSAEAIHPSAFDKAYRRPGRPVIITGVCETTDPWDLEYLLAAIEETNVHVRLYGAKRFSEPKYEWTNYCDFKVMSFGDYAAMLRDGSAGRERAYLAQQNIANTKLWDAVQDAFNNLAAKTGMAHRSSACLWLGPSGHTEPLHFDCGDGTLIQLYGTKEVVLFPPSATHGLYPFPLFGGALPPYFSQVYIDRPDFERFPELRHVLDSQIRVTLNPGEILFIPVYWWHEVTAAGDSYVCSLNRFWAVDAPLRNFVTARAAALHLLSLRPSQAILKRAREMRRSFIQSNRRSES